MTDTVAVSWAAAELGGAKLGDARLNRRLARAPVLGEVCFTLPARPSRPVVLTVRTERVTLRAPRAARR